MESLAGIFQWWSEIQGGPFTPENLCRAGIWALGSVFCWTNVEAQVLESNRDATSQPRTGQASVVASKNRPLLDHHPLPLPVQPRTSRDFWQRLNRLFHNFSEIEISSLPPLFPLCLPHPFNLPFILFFSGCHSSLDLLTKPLLNSWSQLGSGKAINRDTHKAKGLWEAEDKGKQEVQRPAWRKKANFLVK